MKKNLLLSVLVMIMLFFAGITKSQTLMSHWPLDANANDVVGSKNGTVVGGVQFIPDLIRGNVAYFDGADGIIELPGDIFGDTTAIKSLTSVSVSCWFNWEGGAVWQRVYSLGAPKGNWGMLYFCPKDGWDKPGFHVTAHNGILDKWNDYAHDWGSFNEINGTDTTALFDTITPDIWYHSVVILGEGGIQIYMDGVQIVNADSVDITPAAIQVPDSNYNVLGASHWEDPTYKGMISDFQIYNGALSDAQVQNLYTNGTIAVKENISSPLISFYSVNGRILYANKNEINISKISVYSITGKLQFSSKTISELASQQFAKGIYLVTVENNNSEVYTSKVAVVK